MDTGFLSDAAKTTAVLLLVLFLICIAVILLKHFGAGASAGSREGRLRLINTQRLGPKHSVALVEAEGLWLVVGIGPEHVNLLAKMDRPPDSGET